MNSRQFTDWRQEPNVGSTHIISELEDKIVRAHYNRTLHLSKQRIKLEETIDPTWVK